MRSSSSATTATELDEPEKLKRESAGAYRTADGRFEVRNDGGRWFLVDSEQVDELGQALIRGPFPTRDEARAEIAAARSAKLVPLRPRAAKAVGGERRDKATTAKPKPKPTWIDRLPAGEASRVRALVRALEREGVNDAESLVRRDRDGPAPAVVQHLIERRLLELITDVAEPEREAAERLVRRAAAIVAGERGAGAGLPSWRLVEVGPDPAPPNRRVRLPD